MHRDPFLLFGTTKADQEQVRFSRLDSRANRVMIHVQELLEWGRIMASNDQIWVLHFQLGDCFRSGFGTATQKEQTITPLRRNAHQERNQVRSGDSLGQWIAQPA